MMASRSRSAAAQRRRAACNSQRSRTSLASMPPPQISPSFFDGVHVADVQQRRGDIT
jgi:hypothetical protein